MTFETRMQQISFGTRFQLWIMETTIKVSFTSSKLHFESLSIYLALFSTLYAVIDKQRGKSIGSDRAKSQNEGAMWFGEFKNFLWAFCKFGCKLIFWRGLRATPRLAISIQPRSWATRIYSGVQSGCAFEAMQKRQQIRSRRPPKRRNIYTSKNPLSFAHRSFTHSVLMLKNIRHRPSIVLRCLDHVFLGRAYLEKPLIRARPLALPRHFVEFPECWKLVGPRQENEWEAKQKATGSKTDEDFIFWPTVHLTSEQDLPENTMIELDTTRLAWSSSWTKRWIYENVFAFISILIREWRLSLREKVS